LGGGNRHCRGAEETAARMVDILGHLGQIHWWVSSVERLMLNEAGCAARIKSQRGFAFLSAATPTTSEPDPISPRG
jgi:hypothetical protein